MRRGPYTVGVSFFVRKEKATIWSNGGDQNCAFLLRLLSRCRNVSKAVAVNGGDGAAFAPASMMGDLGFELVSPAEAAESCDVLVECGAQLEAGIFARVRERGGRAVTYKYGNAYVIDAERAIHGKPAGSIFNGSVFDEVWTTPQHVRTCRSYWEISYRAPVRVLPHVWEPLFVDKAVAEFPPDLRFGYAPPHPTKRRAVVLEPNVNLVKVAHVPMLAAEVVHRRAPGRLSEVYVTNALHLKDNLAFNSFAANLDVVRDGVMTFEGRFNAPFLLSRYADVVVSHQWENALNYAYYDAIYGGYPLVHNANGLRDLWPDAGYFYEGFDAGAAAERLLEACTMGPKPADRRVLEEVDGRAPAIVRRHEKAIDELFA